MFGNGMMKKLQEMQQQVEEVKERLNHIKMVGEARDGDVRVEVNGNGVITDIRVKGDIQGDELISLIITAGNRALEAANRTKEMEMAQSAKGIIPGM
ncbi:MAG: YbaB/EbfC family nucleoid-associated protein [Flavobacteriales bacterium]|nr:YbaB/EbfC family nucleoid-associated protein [Flavobacteriales bacterium]